MNCNVNEQNLKCNLKFNYKQVGFEYIPFGESVRQSLWLAPLSSSFFVENKFQIIGSTFKWLPSGYLSCLRTVV